MKSKLIILTATAFAVASSVLFSAQLDAKTEAKIKEIKERHNRNCEMQRNGIQAGYLACRLGIPLTNYLADVDAAWDKLLADRIAEVSKR